MSSSDEPQREPDPSADAPTRLAELRLVTDADMPRSEEVERDEDFYNEVLAAVGGGPRSILFGTSQRSIRRAIDQIKTAQSAEPPRMDSE